MLFRRALRVSLAALFVGLGAIAICVAALAFIDGNRLRGPLAREISRRTGREVRIDGSLHAHLLSLHPRVTAEGVTIGNPPWIMPGTMATFGRLTVIFDLPWPGRTFALRELRLDGVDLHLRRDAAAHANWYWKAPGTLPGKGAPPIYRLTMPNAHVVLDDDRRHLSFDGNVTVGDSPVGVDAGGAAPLLIAGKGHLNGREVTLTIAGDPLATAARDKPYHFTAAEHSSGSEVLARGSVSQPFDFRVLEANFQAHGADLMDLYFLVGVKLIDTGPYRVTGKLTRRYTNFMLSDVVTTFGQSDTRMTLTSRMFPSGKSHVEVKLDSRRLRLADLGARAANRASGLADHEPLLLPENPLRLDGLRHTSSVIEFHARELDASRLSFQEVSGSMWVEYGRGAVPRLSAKLPDGRIRAHGVFDARSDRLTAGLDMDFTHVRLGQLASKNPTRPPPLEGPLYGHVSVTGHGRSVHELAANADGNITVALPEGVMRASLAELTGANLRGMAMTLSGNEKETPVRCALASFQGRGGTFVAQQLMIDTDRALITGEGKIQLGTEALDLRIRGQPKRPRLIRLSGPIAIQGTLAHPSFGVEKHDRKLELIDPGRGKNVDCATELAEARTDGVPIGAAFPVPSERELAVK